MKISTEIDSIASFVGEEKAVELVAKAGFDAWDFSMFAMCPYDWSTGQPLPTDHPLASPNYLQFARRLKQIGLDNGIVCNQSHAPFPSAVPGIRGHLKRAIECTAEAGGKICIIHPDNDAAPEENAEMYRELLPFAKSCGVKIATENMYNWDPVRDEPCFAACATSQSFNAHLDAVNDDFFVACLDIGHAEMRSSGSGAANMIRALGSRLQALHLHDNDLHGDSHQIPFSMSIDFDQVVKALKEIGYSGEFTLEASSYLGSAGYTAENVLDGVRNLADSAKRLARMFEEA